MLSVKITHLHLKTPADTLRSINAAGAHNLIEAHFKQSAGHQETPPIALGGLLSAPHPADTLPEHLYSKCATCVHFPLRLSDSFMHIACAGVSPFAAKGVHPPTPPPRQQQKDHQRRPEKQHPCKSTSDQSEYNS